MHVDHVQAPFWAFGIMPYQALSRQPPMRNGSSLGTVRQSAQTTHISTKKTTINHMIHVHTSMRRVHHPTRNPTTEVSVVARRRAVSAARPRSIPIPIRQQEQQQLGRRLLRQRVQHRRRDVRADVLRRRAQVLRADPRAGHLGRHERGHRGEVSLQRRVVVRLPSRVAAVLLLLPSPPSWRRRRAAVGAAAAAVFGLVLSGVGKEVQQRGWCAGCLEELAEEDKGFCMGWLQLMARETSTSLRGR
jgi:hypothetical protein